MTKQKEFWTVRYKIATEKAERIAGNEKF